MISKSFSKSGKLLTNVRQYFSATIAVISGGPQYDKQAQNIMDGLNQTFNNDVKFIGVGGPTLKNYFSKFYANSQELDQHPFQNHRNYIQAIHDTPIIPYRTKTHLKNYKIMKKIIAGGYLQDLVNENVCAVINVYNFSLARRLDYQIMKHYASIHKIAPPTLLYERLHTLQGIQNQQFLDYLFYTHPNQITALNRFEFPSMCIGFDGVYNAYRFLSKYSLGSMNTQSFGSQYFSDEVYQMTQGARREYRARLGINEDNFVILISPGNTVKQVEFTLKQTSQAIRQFFNNPEISAYGKNNFNVLILNPENQYAQQKLSKLIGNIQSTIKTLLVPVQDKYAALSSSDYGIIHDGQRAVQAAACQLSATVVNSMGYFHAYLSDMINIYESPLNIATDSMGYTQLKSKSEANPNKLQQQILEHFKRPKLKFFYIDRYEEALQRMLKKSGYNPTLSVQETGLQTSFKFVKMFADKYQSLDKGNYSQHWDARKKSIMPGELLIDE